MGQSHTVAATIDLIRGNCCGLEVGGRHADANDAVVSGSREGRELNSEEKWRWLILKESLKFDLNRRF